MIADPEVNQRQANRQSRRERRRARREANAGQANTPPVNAEMGDWNPSEWEGRLESIYNDVMDPSRADPTTDPIFQNVADQIRTAGKRDFLGLYDSLNANANAGGRFGGDTWQLLAQGAQRETETNVFDAIERMFAGEVNTNRDRIAGLYDDIAGYNVGMGNVNVGYENAEANQAQARASMVGARASMRNARTNAAELAFNKKMALAAAQQDALNDYYNIMAGIGGWGGSQYGTSPGQYTAQSNPWLSGAMGAAGAYMNQSDGGAIGSGGGGGGSFGGITDWWGNNFNNYNAGGSFIPTSNWLGGNDSEGGVSPYDWDYGSSM